MSDQLRIDYRPRPDISPEQEAEILASVYSFLLKCHAQQAADDGGLHPTRVGGAYEALKAEPNEKVVSTE
jgi:hypothetical protein